MPQGIGASGFAGLAFETIPGTYVPPTKFFPFESESLNWVQDTQWRRPIRQSADNIGAVLGDGHVEGDIKLEFLEDVVPYFLYAARTAVTKTGASAPFTYLFKGSNAALPNRTISLTIVRNGQVFGYTGVSVNQSTIAIENGILKYTATLLGYAEASQTLPVPVFATTAPFSPGQYNVQVGGVTVLDTDTFSFVVNDNGAAQNRLHSTRGATFISYGERNVQCTMDRDFIDRTEYDAFKIQTSQHISFAATKGAGASVTLDLPVGVKSTYAINLGGQGDLLRVSNAWDGVIDGTGNAYSLTIITSEAIT